MAEPVFQRPGEGRASDNPLGVELVFKVRGEQTDGTLTAFENLVASGEGPPLHTHANEDYAKGPASIRHSPDRSQGLSV